MKGTLGHASGWPWPPSWRAHNLSAEGRQRCVHRETPDSVRIPRRASALSGQPDQLRTCARDEGHVSGSPDCPRVPGLPACPGACILCPSLQWPSQSTSLGKSSGVSHDQGTPAPCRPCSCSELGSSPAVLHYNNKNHQQASASQSQPHLVFGITQ